MKRMLSLIICLAMLFALSACSRERDANVTVIPLTPTESKSPAAVPTPAAPTPAPPAREPDSSVERQLSLIMQERSVWDKSAEELSEYERYSYCVTDLDGNGRLEIIAAITQGTGIYTYGDFYEVGADFCFLVDIYEPVSEYDTLPELIMSSVPMYRHKESDTNYYIFNNNTRVGAAEFYNTIVALSLKDGRVIIPQVAYFEDIYIDGGQREEKNYYDANRNTLTEDEYNTLVERYYGMMEAHTAHFGWFTLNDGELPELLTNSYKVFTGELDSMPLPVNSSVNVSEPQGSAPAASNIRITKNPTSEALSVGGKTWFIAHADGADALEWMCLDPNGNRYSLDSAMAGNPGLTLTAMEGDTLAVSDVPASFNGWSVYALFSNSDGSRMTTPAYIYVGDYVSAYSAVLQKYRDAISASAEITPEVAYSLNISELAAYCDKIGYAFKDLNKDGTPELIVASIASDTSDKIAFEIATLENGEPKVLCTSQARDRFYITTDNRILEIGSGGAAYSYYTLYKLENASLVKTLELNSDLDGNNQSFWHYIDHASGAAEQTLKNDDGLARADALWYTSFIPPLTSLGS